MTACTELQLAGPNDGVAREGQKGMPIEHSVICSLSTYME
jgi:hypothetical protein